MHQRLSPAGVVAPQLMDAYFGACPWALPASNPEPGCAASLERMPASCVSKTFTLSLSLPSTCISWKELHMHLPCRILSTCAAHRANLRTALSTIPLCALHASSAVHIPQCNPLPCALRALCAAQALLCLGQRHGVAVQARGVRPGQATVHAATSGPSGRRGCWRHALAAGPATVLGAAAGAPEVHL